MVINQFHETYQSFKPANLIKTMLNNFAEKPGIVNKIVYTALKAGFGLKGGVAMLMHAFGAIKNMLAGGRRKKD